MSFYFIVTTLDKVPENTVYRYNRNWYKKSKIGALKRDTLFEKKTATKIVNFDQIESHPPHAIVAIEEPVIFVPRIQMFQVDE